MRKREIESLVVKTVFWELPNEFQMRLLSNKSSQKAPTQAIHKNFSLNKAVSIFGRHQQFKLPTFSHNIRIMLESDRLRLSLVDTTSQAL